MNRYPILVLAIGLSSVLSACSGAASPPAATPTAPPVAPTPGPTVAVWLNNCTLLSSRDAASFFTTAEVEGPDHTLNDVNRTIFSSEPVSATESSCIYYVFHHPGDADMKLLQITYWVDVRGRATEAAWQQVWSEASSTATQAVSGIGEAAFYSDGRLSFRKSDVYVTIGIVTAGKDYSIAPGSAQQLDVEKQVALFMVPNMG
jgi:hypothetical protein